MTISRNVSSMLLINLCLNMENMYIFWEKIERSLQKDSIKGGGGCILWSGSCDRHGYGRKTVTWCTTGKLKVELAHRVAYVGAEVNSD